MSSFDGDDFDGMSQEDYNEYLRQQYGEETIDDHQARYEQEMQERDLNPPEENWNGVF